MLVSTLFSWLNHFEALFASHGSVQRSYAECGCERAFIFNLSSLEFPRLQQTSGFLL